MYAAFRNRSAHPSAVLFTDSTPSLGTCPEHGPQHVQPAALTLYFVPFVDIRTDMVRSRRDERLVRVAYPCRDGRTRPRGSG
ncbi:hypothetical protein AMK22_04910 [Streptomyces sp. CB01580]|nr:hypothetical protein AMK22_04910 [Streptomyces sp. CB01580]